MQAGEGAAKSGTSARLQLEGPITEYKAYVTDQVNQLVSNTQAFTDAVKAGDVEKAKALFAPTRQYPFSAPPSPACTISLLFGLLSSPQVISYSPASRLAVSF